MGKECTLELIKINSQRSLVLWIKSNGRKEYVVCSYYDPTKEIGSQWYWGHYFFNLFDAVEYAKEIKEGVA